MESGMATDYGTLSE